LSVQRLHPHLGPLDILTSEELSKVMGHILDQYERDLNRGIKLIKLPPVRVINGGGTGPLLISQTVDAGAPIGPEQGFIWRLLRLTVASSGTDAGSAALYVSSDPTLIDQTHLIDNTLKIGQAYFPGNRGVFLFAGEFIYANAPVVVANTQYAMTGMALEVPAEMVGKLAGG
jgi:hypothetical protein